ncbi:MAG: cell wall metabolism sensor histidine kinase WalK [Bacteroidetes bacterium]|nr:cell wall metabolism sensor histidine kinase WalK [Bacteroidota bacterium]
MRALSRLRWQLTLSHLAAIAVTLVSMIAAVVLIASSIWHAGQSNPASTPAQDAEIIASSVGGMVVRDLNGSASTGAGSGELSDVLSSVVRGDLHVQIVPPFVSEQARRYGPFGSVLRNLGYIAVFGHDGRVVASSEPSGAGFTPPERLEWSPLVRAALSGARDTSSLVVLHPSGGPGALSAYPIQDGSGRTVAAVLVAETSLPISGGFTDFWQVLAFFSAVSVVVLTGASVFALLSSSVVAYLLSRRLVGRLERLGRAVESLAEGDLSRRVEEGPDDEVGQLARRFNNMASRLAGTMAELETEKQHAESALRAKRELVANVSHELRTPLASIRGHTESLVMNDAEVDGADRREYLNVIYRETEHLSRLIDDLFALSRAEAGALPLSLGPISLGEVVDEVVSGIRSVARNERHISLVSEVDPSLPPVLADRQRAAQVLGNLVRNAVRYTPEGGLISVRASLQDDHAEVTVEDTGLGIPPDQLPHIFERFYRGDEARARASGGAGLGLAIVRELVEAMGGEVRAESVVGQGSRFSFTLPLASRTAPAQGAV